MFNETCPHFDEMFDEYYGQRLKEFVTDTKILDDAFVAMKKFYLKVHKELC